jgi:hypothetical protein
MSDTSMALILTLSWFISLMVIGLGVSDWGRKRND